MTFRLPDGTYEGTLSGSQLRLTYDGIHHEFRLSQAIRGSSRVRFEITDGKVLESSVENIADDS